MRIATTIIPAFVGLTIASLASPMAAAPCLVCSEITYQDFSTKLYVSNPRVYDTTSTGLAEIQVAVSEFSSTGIVQPWIQGPETMQQFCAHEGYKGSIVYSYGYWGPQVPWNGWTKPYRGDPDATSNLCKGWWWRYCKQTGPGSGHEYCDKGAYKAEFIKIELNRTRAAQYTALLMHAATHEMAHAFGVGHFNHPGWDFLPPGCNCWNLQTLMWGQGCLTKTPETELQAIDVITLDQNY